jgi:hypothetical protein
MGFLNAVVLVSDLVDCGGPTHPKEEEEEEEEEGTDTR